MGGVYKEILKETNGQNVGHRLKNHETVAFVYLNPLRDRQPSFTESENSGKKIVAVFVSGQLLYIIPK